ncbi:MAG TPA: hypothetical protein VMU64_04095 [Acidimicrobiales bacterium]|nr:hypothetical protein [Acidimicrobiales bacterium]
MTRLARRTTTWSTALWTNPITSAAAVGAVFTVAAWPVLSLSPATGLDQSWGFGLASAAVKHIAWGPNLDFTYGPLGFLTVRTLYFGSTAALAFVYQFVVLWALFTLLFRFCRATLPLIPAALVSYGIGATAIALVDPGDLLMAPTILLGILALRQQQTSVRRLLVTVLITVSALGFFIKFADGLVPLGIVVVIVALGRGRARVLEAAGSAVVFAFVLIVTWLATGNGLGSLPAYFRYGAAIASGYSGAMQLEMGRTDEWFYAVAVLVIIATLTFFGVRSASRREQVGTALILVGYTWWALKEGFVRHDAHDLIFFGLMFVTVAVCEFSLPRSRVLYVTAVAVVAVLAWSAAGAIPPNVLAFSADAHGFGHQLNTIATRQLRNLTVNAARDQMRQTYGLSSAMLDELNGHSVAIEPWENSVAWAYPSVHWDPEPVLQTYSAYTTSLDVLDSDFLESRQAPTRILQQAPAAIDGRNPAFEPPTTTVTSVCRYVQVDASAAWQVLTRVPDRCGAPRLMARETATVGRPVKVPAASPGTMVVARFESLPLPITYEFAAVVLKPPIMFMTASGQRDRFIVGTAGDLHLLRPASSTGYTAPFVPDGISTFELSGAGMAQGTSHYVVSFYSIRVATR